MRTIESPGVEIFERDLTFNTQLPVGTTVFAVGYAPQGPTDELVNVTTVSEFEQIYGLPTNASERYFYHTVKQILNANATLLCTRLPYGSGSGDGFTTDYSALVYPVFPYGPSVLSYTSTTAPSGYVVGSPYLTDLYFTLTADANTFSGWASTDNIGLLSSLNVPVLQLSGIIGGAQDYKYYYDSATYPVLSSAPGAAGTTATVVSTDINGSVFSAAFHVQTPANDADYRGLMGVAFQTITATSLVNLKDATEYYVGEPRHLSLDETTYFQWSQGGINWKNIISNSNTVYQNISGVNGAGYAGFVIVNKAKTTIDDYFEGYYIALADNSKMDKGSNFDSIAKLKTINNTTASDEWLEVNTTRLAFGLSGSFTDHQGSISEITESVPSFDFSNEGAGGFADSLILTMFKIRPTIYNADEKILDNVLVESYVGSFDSTRQLQNPRGGAPLNFYLEDIVNDESRNMQMFVNPNITRNGGAWFDPQTSEPLKKIRIMMDGRVNEQSTIATDPAQPNGAALMAFNAASANIYMSNGDNLYGIGEFTSCLSQDQKLIGNLPYKLERALTLADNRDLIRVDILPEGGLGTIWTGMMLDMDNWPAGTVNPNAADQIYQSFDDTKYVDGILNSHTFDADSEGLFDQATGRASEANDLYETIYNVFNNFAESNRKDCLYIADPLRYVFVQGVGEVKVLDDKTKNFSQHVYWPLKNLFGAANSSYACTYANWFKANDKATAKMVWLPPSGFLGRIMVQVDTNQFPWYAPAGLNRGILRDVLDIGINPNQRQRDLLYKIGINPTVYWPGDGYVVWGQKTLLQKPSAFDRINVRRLFLWLEKATMALTRYFVFEPNTVFTRERLKTALDPIFSFAKNNQGVYDYLIVCDERNNTPEVIDRNELVVDIYIKPVRVAEFILVNFIATRTGQDFNELI